MAQSFRLQVPHPTVCASGAGSVWQVLAANLSSNSVIKSLEFLSAAIAQITEEFRSAYFEEVFVAALSDLDWWKKSGHSSEQELCSGYMLVLD